MSSIWVVPFINIPSLELWKSSPKSRRSSCEGGEVSRGRRNSLGEQVFRECGAYIIHQSLSAEQDFLTKFSKVHISLPTQREYHLSLLFHRSLVSHQDVSSLWILLTDLQSLEQPCCRRYRRSNSRSTLQSLSLWINVTLLNPINLSVVRFYYHQMFFVLWITYTHSKHISKDNISLFRRNTIKTPSVLRSMVHLISIYVLKYIYFSKRWQALWEVLLS
jgi:hypothetical protein